MIDLHGRLDRVRRTACSVTSRRADFQDELVRLNAAWADLDALALPDEREELGRFIEAATKIRRNSKLRSRVGAARH